MSANILKDIACFACREALVPVDSLLKNDLFKYLAEGFDTLLCETLKIEGGDPQVCKGTIHIMAHFALGAAVQGPLSSVEMCTEFLNLCSSPKI